MKSLTSDTQVYCTACVHGEQLIQCLLAATTQTVLPVPCQTCGPDNCEDSLPFKERPHYVPSHPPRHDDV